MKWLFFLYQYIREPRTVGAILPSSKYVAKKMIDQIDFSDAKYIVEYGPGTGVFTEKLLKNRREQTVLLLIESNRDFYELLKEKYHDQKNMIIVNGSAENTDKYLSDYRIPYVNYVVSGLPFASLPKHVSSNILQKTRNALGRDGKFITFQYTQYKKNFIRQFFKRIDVSRELRNMPPAYIFSCSK